MYEFSLAFKYLLPKRKQLSVALISLMSVGVITVVSWLLLVFFSVTEGLEKTWLHKITSLNAAIRINPTHTYFSSYYYNIDHFAADSSYRGKTLGEKLITTVADPFDVEIDQHVGTTLAKPLNNSDGSLKDLAKTAETALREMQKKFKGLVFNEYEIGGASLRLELIRHGTTGVSHTHLNQVAYVSNFAENSPYQRSLIEMPASQDFKMTEDGVLLPKNFYDSGARIGDKGFISYGALSASALQEQKMPVKVVGFYDPGIVGLGGKVILTSKTLAHTLASSSSSYALEKSLSNGFLVWVEDLQQTKDAVASIKESFSKMGIASFFAVTPYYEYDFAKDLLQQFQSDKILFTLVGVIILIVACCNIVSLLNLLVNDKKKEIAVLASLGASKKSLVMIFCFCGLFLGVVSAVFGILLAQLTLHNIDSIVAFLTYVQGYNPFNEFFYGSTLPKTLSKTAIWYVLVYTPLLSLLAGFIPSLKAIRLSPASALRSE